MLQLRGHEGTVHALTFGADGGTLISAGRDRTIRVWDVPSGTERWRLESLDGVALALALHPLGRALAVGTEGKTLALWDVGTGKLVHSYADQMATVTGVVWLAGRSVLAMSCGERLRSDRPGELKLRDFEGTNFFKSLRVEERGLWSLAVAKRGTFLAWSGGARGVCAWEITGQHVKTFRHPISALAVALSLDGSLLASSHDRIVKLWDTDTGRERASFEEHRGLVRALTFSPDGSMLASAGQDQTVRCWHVAGEPRPGAVFEWPTGAVHALAFSPDGLTAAAAGESGDVWVWDIDQ